MDEPKKPGFFDFLRWQWNRWKKGIPGPEGYQFPIADNDPAYLRSNCEKTTLTWIGHATLLLQMAGKNILTDPVYSDRASPVRWAGPRRVVPPGLPFEALPPIHLVVLSHDHYDALDRRTVMNLHNRPGGGETTFFVPLGLKRWFAGPHIDRVVEVPWWGKGRLDNLEITAVPVKHWSSRGPFSEKKTSWGGWVIGSKDFRFCFVGDSGYTPRFREIGERLGPFDLTAIPIGAYEPRWFMRSHHMNPEEAVRVHCEVRSKKSVAIHWGTFILTDEPLSEPPERLRKAMEKERIPAGEFLILRHGETVILDERRSGRLKRVPVQR